VSTLVVVLLVVISRFFGAIHGSVPATFASLGTIFSQQMDMLGIEPRALRMRSRCDTTTPHALGASFSALCHNDCTTLQN